MTRSTSGQGYVGLAALLLLPLLQYAIGGDNDTVVITLVGEPTLLAVYLARTRQPQELWARLLICGVLLVPLAALLAFFAVMFFLLVTQGDQAFS